MKKFFLLMLLPAAALLAAGCGSGTAPESEEMAEAVGADCEMSEMETGKEK